MTPEEWQRVKTILESALELDSAHRPTFLDQSCADPFLRREVESLIAMHEQADTEVLKPSPFASFNAREEARFRFLHGRHIGAYEIHKEIAVGGMGAVYSAVRADGLYKQQVALKIVRPELCTDLTAIRFKSERQILASLNHPNIAKILDGGTTEEDVPYLVMELIDGQRIDEYCDAHKLDTTERLGVFLQICSAVQYAHQRLIIHRDIKPGNILVTADGVPKLLDFGIAKILGASDPSDQSAQTISVIRLLTPEYASPEQVKNEPITTASDVYSLGVLLFELLTGRIPYNILTHTPHEISRAVCEEEPEKPSTAVRRRHPTADGKGKQTGDSVRSDVWEGSPEKVSKRLSGDLDNILLMALRKEPQRRYASVDQFAQDIRRHLDHLPVLARKDTFGYRTSKFITRHRAGVAGTALLAVALLSALGVTLRQVQIARTERARAERRFNDVRALANSLIFDIHDGISQLPGTTQVRELLVKKALLYFDSLSNEAAGDASLQRELANAYDRVGSLQWSTDFANLGDVAGALQSRRKALAIRESLAAANPNDKTIQLELTDEYIALGDTIESTGDFAGALEISRKAPPILERVVDQNSSPKLLDRRASGYYRIARLLNEVDDPAGALENYRRSAAIREVATARATDSGEMILFRNHLAGDHYGIAESMMLTNRLGEASREQKQAVQILEELSRSNPNRVPLRESLGNSYVVLGTIYEKQGDANKALESRRRAREIFKELTTSDPKNALARYNFAFADESLAESLVATGNVPEALRHIQAALATFQADAAGGSKDRYVSSGLAECYFALGLSYSALAAKGKGSVADQTKLWQEARAWYQKSSDIWTEKRNRGSLDGSSERETADRAAQGITKCDVALAKLGAGIH